MKKLTILIIAVVCLAIASCKHTFKPIRSFEKGDATDSVSAANRYRLHEIIVIYKGTPTEADADAIRTQLVAGGITDPITVRKCFECKERKGYVELWKAKNIHTRIHAEGVTAGTVSSKPTTVGEDVVAYYSVNFFNNIPMDTTLSFKNFKHGGKVEFSGKGKDTITVAVLDTGIDVDTMMSPKFQWKNADETRNGKDDDRNCYEDDTLGWNFIENNSDVDDDNINLHGTLVSHYIINEFALSPGNFVQIMSLKTHDGKGQGDLFSIICALHYAMEKGANIINASWGFYYYHDAPHPYLDKLITDTMRQNKILFVTAAGNKDKNMDAFARSAYREEHGVEFPYGMLRNLEYHNFYPACLSRKGRNVVTVTTADGTLVSPTQNYSEQYVDVGVMGDVNDANSMKFITPFPGEVFLISGSSFATAIASGKFGAYYPKPMYASGLDKDAVFEQLRTTTPFYAPPLITFETVMRKQLIRDGKMTYPK